MIHQSTFIHTLNHVKRADYVIQNVSANAKLISLSFPLRSLPLDHYDSTVQCSRISIDDDDVTH